MSEPIRTDFRLPELTATSRELRRQAASDAPTQVVAVEDQVLEKAKVVQGPLRIKISKPRQERHLLRFSARDVH